MSHLYGILGIANGADSAQVKSAFRKLAKASHPDLHCGDKEAERRFKEISRAYETLGNPEARAEYDAECAEARARARSRFRSAAATMSATFVLTVGSGLVVAGWLSGV